jgi:hypothetical protein
MSSTPAPSLIRTKQAIIQVFDDFRRELDDHNDRRERLIKVTLFILSDNLTSTVIYIVQP